MPVLKIKQNGSWVEVWGAINSDSISGTVLIEDEQGNQFMGAVVDDITVVTATPDDIKLGKTAVTEDGIVTGTHACK